jgi:hypothetical protein
VDYAEAREFSSFLFGELKALNHDMSTLHQQAI